MTVLIDTNVILDYVLKREPFAQSASDCLEYLLINKGKCKSWLTASTITDIYYVARRALNNNTSAKYEDALQIQCADRLKADYIITHNINDFVNSTIQAVTTKEFNDNLT